MRGKKLELTADTLSHEMNLNINTGSPSEFDIRHPARKYTIDVAKDSTVTVEKSKKQLYFKNI